jgi:hypothetical protein
MPTMENKNLVKGKMAEEVGYKKLAVLLDNEAKQKLIDIINNVSVCELRQKQILSDGTHTVTVKFYFPPNGS